MYQFIEPFLQIDLTVFIYKKMCTHTIKLRFGVGTSIRDEKNITDLSKKVQVGLTSLITRFINDLESLCKEQAYDTFSIKNKTISYDANGRIRLELLIYTSMPYNELFEQIDMVKYWDYPGVFSEISNKSYSLIDLEFIQ
jgi:hypothetical protein